MKKSLYIVAFTCVQVAFLLLSIVGDEDSTLGIWIAVITIPIWLFLNVVIVRKLLAIKNKEILEKQIEMKNLFEEECGFRFSAVRETSEDERDEWILYLVIDLKQDKTYAITPKHYKQYDYEIESEKLVEFLEENYEQIFCANVNKEKYLEGVEMVKSYLEK